MTDNEDYTNVATPKDHATSHQDGGSDEIDVAGLSGELTDEQNTAWAKVSGKPTTFPPASTLPHKASHQDGGADEINLAALSGELADDQPPKPHALGGAKHTAATLAELNAKISDATLDDASAARTPSAHKASHEKDGSDEIDCTGLVGAGGGGIVDPSSCRALLSANQSTVSGAWRVVELDVIDFDDQGDFNTVTHRFVCSTPGTYIACCAVKILNLANGNTMGCALWKNGAVAGGRVAFVIGGSSSPGAAGTDIFQLEVDDYLELASFHNYGSNRDVQGGLIFTNYLAIHRIG